MPFSRKYRQNIGKETLLVSTKLNGNLNPHYTGPDRRLLEGQEFCGHYNRLLGWRIASTVLLYVDEEVDQSETESVLQKSLIP